MLFIDIDAQPQTEHHLLEGKGSSYQLWSTFCWIVPSCEQLIYVRCHSLANSTNAVDRPADEVVFHLDKRESTDWSKRHFKLAWIYV